jgi:pimeloyl-ACP methyl ester carboxylesterase
MRRIVQSAGALALGLVMSARCFSGDLPPRRSVALFGQKIEYYDVGSGPVVVLLHGLGSSARGDWGACIMKLSAHHRVLAPDQLGFGASDRPIIDYGIQTWVDFLGEFLRVEKVEDFALAGESLGGWIAAQYSIQALSAQPATSPSFALPRPARLVLVDAGGHRHLAEAIGQGGPGLSLAGSKALLSAIYVDPARSTDDAARAQFAMSLSKGDGWTIHSLLSNRSILAECVDDKLGQITIPTLVVWGAGDRLVPVEDGRDFASRIPGARLVIIAGSGHAPEIEKSGEFLAAVEPFLDSQ